MKPRTLDSYHDVLRLHPLPALGATPVRLLHRRRLRTLLVDKLRANLSRKTVRLIHATLRAVLNEAVEDGVLLSNPADHLAGKLNLVAKPRERQENIKALTREQLTAFLAAP